MKNLHKLLTLIFLSLISCDKDDSPTKVIDLKADITYEMVSQSSATSGTIKIIAHVKNVGNSSFTSSANQQVVNLVVKTPGAADFIVEHLDFTSVPKDEELTFNITRQWNTADEFPQSYELRIVYDPDLFIDGSTDNDDTNQSNDIFLLSGTTINTLFN
ncbi:hypothetical protein ACFO3U_09505 [Flavobacterium ponti]|uniref:CARDB domain-containing protein n=1 Tax=Flavobacterium ponti TaxID=665133 RepID=A0ABV9P4W7_9FLAO